MKLDLIIPNWPAPENIKAISTTRKNGYSSHPYGSFNLGTHVDDNHQHVMKNRDLLNTQLNIKQTPLWLNQVHGNQIISDENYTLTINADGSYSTKQNIPCVVMTADCLPILITNKSGDFVMALHGGWRGLAADIIEHGINIASSYGNDIIVWLGPAISQANFEIGKEVKEQFLNINPLFEQAFIPSNNENRWLMDMYKIANIKLNELGVTDVYSSQQCTFEQQETFFSYRRDGQTGRMASLIYKDD